MHRLHVRADYSPNAERPFAGDCGGFVGWRHRRWEWMGEEERRAAKALGYSAARWESGVDAPAADKQ